MTADAWMGENFITAAQTVMRDIRRRRWQHVLTLLFKSGQKTVVCF